MKGVLTVQPIVSKTMKEKIIKKKTKNQFLCNTVDVIKLRPFNTSDQIWHEKIFVLGCSSQSDKFVHGVKKRIRIFQLYQAPH